MIKDFFLICKRIVHHYIILSDAKVVVKELQEEKHMTACRKDLTATPVLD